MKRLLARAGPLAVLAGGTGLYWAAVWWLFVASTVMCRVTGACNETGHVYGSLSGFSGTLLFSALMLAPLWYLRHTCHDSWKCLRWGRYPDSRMIPWCWKHHPDHEGQRPTGEFLRRLHRENQRRRAA